MKCRQFARYLLLACLALAACAGGGAVHAVAGPVPPSAPGPTSDEAVATLSIKITVPKKTSSALTRNPAYVAATTQSVAVVVTPSGAPPAAAQLIACSAGTCSGSVGAPAGNDAVTVKLYDQAGGAGNILSTGTSAVAAGAGTATNLNLTFNPVVSTYTFSASGSFGAGTASTVAVNAVAYDADGNTIVGPGSYADSAGNPLTITLAGVTESGGNATLSLSGNMTFTGPSSTAATLSYNGNSSYGATSFAGTSSPARGMIVAAPAAVRGYQITEWNTPTAAAHPWGMTLGPDGNVWFVETSASNVAKITTAGVITEYSITAAQFPDDVAAGPDGKLWVACQNGKIDRINADGTGFVKFSAAVGAAAISIVGGPDGNLWFTDAGNNAIGVMSTAGVMLHNYNGLAAGAINGFAAGHGIIVGPDNNLWFTEAANNKAGRITTTGTVAEFTHPAGSDSLTVGPDGNIWDSSNGSGVTVYNTSGTILHTYGYPGDALLSSAGLRDIVLGRDGNIWLADSSSSVLYRMTANDVVTIFSNGISSGGAPDAMVIGADGNVWFNEPGTSKMARLIYGS